MLLMVACVLGVAAVPVQVLDEQDKAYGSADDNEDNRPEDVIEFSVI
jgi:hypothetical protein